MTREIKFRAWDKEDQCMRYSLELDCKWNIILCLSCPERYQVMQYTGLKDKNGKEIYEGDILEWGDEGSQVVWRENDAMFEIERIFNGFSTREVCEYTIIGDIYSTPELLK